LKLLRDDLAHDKVFIRRFQREAENLASAQHPNIVNFYGLETDGLFTFLLMDFVNGKSLKTAIYESESKGLAPEFVHLVMRSVCAALHYMHLLGLVHCDIKPGNIMINRHEEVLLTDFGIARLTDAATATMVGFGTPAYMAPELVQGKDPTPQSDIYSLGIVLYEMVTGGERPFIGEHAQITGSTGEKVRWEHVNLDPPTPKQYNQNISTALEAVILKCLSKDTEHRYPNALDLLNAVERLFQQKQFYFFEQQERITQPATNPEPDGVSDKPEDESCQSNNVKPKIKVNKWLLIGFGIILLTFVLLTIYHPARISPYGVGSTKINKVDAAMMVFVPPGEFIMGSKDFDAQDDETPAHYVYVNGFWIYKNEVTNSQFAIFLNSDSNKPTYGVTGMQIGDNDLRIQQKDGAWLVTSGYMEHPVVNVSWSIAQAYCEWSGGRLPTEAEWEKAARGDDGRKYPWGDDMPTCQKANFFGCGANTKPVGGFPGNASPYGALDMAGNVAEWVSDFYLADYYEISPYIDPHGPESGLDRVTRGGSWATPTKRIRVTDRSSLNPLMSNNNVGFRCVYSAGP
jgi:serine/threonine-protein kinase